jgi:hypothetical protein
MKLSLAPIPFRNLLRVSIEGFAVELLLERALGRKWACGSMEGLAVKLVLQLGQVTVNLILADGPENRTEQLGQSK